MLISGLESLATQEPKLMRIKTYVITFFTHEN